MSPRTVVLTFDNLGEVAELEEGTWPHERLRGRHPSVTVALPALLDTLDRLGLRATFCVEGINTREYPGAVREIAERGHEIALHGWRHERWDEFDERREAAIIRRGRDAFAAMGVEVRGFRPPGGGLSERTPSLLADAGLAWCSPAGERPAVDPAGPAIVPFRWPLVDATYLHEPFTSSPLSAEDAGRRLWAEVEDERAEAAVLVLHPFLAARPDVGAMVAGLLERLTDFRVLPAGRYAEEVRA
jgi:peptidoglycan/xylan/chitin deacetylase (PgdA/CDA1 family)